MRITWRIIVDFHNMKRFAAIIALIARFVWKKETKRRIKSITGRECV